ncbi:MAG: glycoside hydrolase family 3 C-terminal domain-containing protein [Terracidiphilus sp.]|jgi:beta-glucosidase
MFGIRSARAPLALLLILPFVLALAGCGSGSSSSTLRTPTIIWATPAAIPYGTALSGTQLDATSAVAGTFAYTPASGTVLTAGAHTLSVTLTPTDTTDYTTATKTVSLTVNQATPTISWATPAAIPYGTALSGTQLDASSTVAGTFAYTPAAGTVLAAGTQTLSVTLTPTDTTDYTTATAIVSLTVNPPTTADGRADAMLAQMSQADKLAMVQGGVTTNLTYGYTVPRGAAGFVPGNVALGIPELYLADGSVGVGNGVGPATALPSSIASAASWDTNEATKYGNIIGTELADYGINVNLGGNINLIGREPRDGRTFETKGEDPILAGKITAAHLNAIQAAHVIADIKHFAFNDQETGRSTANAIIDERGGRESDLLAFEIGVKDSNVQSVMCSYNLTNGQYDCENDHLLNQVLKGDWSFPGFVMSDWWATHSTDTAAINGLDQEQPNQQYFSTLGQDVASGAVPQSRLDNMVHRILRAMYEVGIFDNPQKIQAIPAVADAAVAQEIEEQGAVLLKNANSQLPLNGSTVQSIAVIGLHADTAVLSGGGSAQVQPIGGAMTQGQPCPPCWATVTWDLTSPMQAIKAMAPNAQIDFTDGTDAKFASQEAAASQVAIVFVNQWASEGMDEPSLNLTDLILGQPVDQDALVAAVAAANPHTIVVVESGGPILMPWLSQVSAVLEAWYPGQNGGPAIADLLFGVTNPSGKLPITFPASEAQLPRPAIPQPPANGTFDVNYTEGYNVGYKWYDTQGFTPLFPFGYGLSYTTFSITNAAIVNNLSSASNPNFQVTFNLANTGTVAGAEVAQIYLGLPASLNEPPKRLVGWQKVLLQPGASQPVTIEVDQNDSSHPMSYWDTGSSSWMVAPGSYTVYLGNSEAAGSLTTVGTITVAE